MRWTHSSVPAIEARSSSSTSRLIPQNKGGLALITRTAIFEGRIKLGMEDRFFSEIKERLVPLWKQFPHASNVRLLPVTAADDDALPIAMIQQIDYPSMEALEH